ncbi:hypothetical protein GGE68_001424 [Rhizobium leguminosarum]|uniref:portal protein n=1 Tax=Rhizobium leguminosarum TaxID=384 RepID=UPI00161926D2|nr:hypothetical protein [Rhizobium leguminosarum]MBB5663248.1 hypothetical protein [Rhizobium leguminosarum]
MAARHAKKIDEVDLKALIASEINDAEVFVSTEVVQERVRAINYYNGEMPDTPHQQGWSQFKSRDVADVIGWVLPGIIRVFTASDRIVDYEPTKPGDEAFTDQASDYANYVFWKDNDGYRIMWDATHDSLLQADGIVKTYWDDSEECEYSVHSGLDDQSLALLLEDPDVEIISQKAAEPFTDIDPNTGQPVEIPLYDVKIKHVTSKGRLVMETVEPENFLKDRESITIEGARFVCHRDPHVTRSKLIEMGFDKDIVESLPRYNFSSSRLTPEANARDPYQFGNANGDPSMDRIELYECYIKADVNGDGIAETVLAYYAGASGAGELLDWEVWDDDLPFTQIPCEPVPHRFTSRSLAGDVMDIQQIKTSVGRQLLNNAYQVNNPQKDIEAGSVINMDELVNPSVGGVIIRKPGSQPVNYTDTPSILQDAIATLGFMDQVIEMRTGVSRATMALDPETLQNQTATANQNQHDSAYSQVELIARNQAELGWKKVFAKVLRLIVKHQDRPRMIRLRDEWVEMDPRQWNATMDAQINVGLGTGSRDRDMAMLNNILTSQIAITDRFQMSGLSEKAIEMMPKIRKTLVKIVEAAGIKNADSFYPDIDDADLQQIKQMADQAAQQPPPEVQVQQAKLQADMQKSQAELQLKQQDQQSTLQMTAMQNEANIQLQREKMQQDAALQAQKMQMDYELRVQQINAEIQLKREQLGAEIELKRELAAMGQENGGTQVSSDVRPGGEPG